MNKSIIIFKTKHIEKINISDKYLEYKIWKPSLINIKPPDKKIKYIFYWIFHYLGVFKNKNYCSVIVLHGKIIVASLLVVPTHFKWPFMSKNDIQFTYVLTNNRYRGKGLAGQMIYFASKKLKNIDTYWYITDNLNDSSIKVAIKAGFQQIQKDIKIGNKRLMIK